MQTGGLDHARLSAVARGLGRCLRPGDVLLLSGPMGVGKTTFTRALAVGLGVDDPDAVRSPTFNVCLVHPGPIPLLHVDLFRFADVSEGARGAAALDAVGLAELGTANVPGGEGVTVVEWGELWSRPPAAALRLALSSPAGDPEGARSLGVKWDDASWGPRLQRWAEEITRGEALDRA